MVCLNVSDISENYMYCKYVHSIQGMGEIGGDSLMLQIEKCEGWCQGVINMVSLFHVECSLFSWQPLAVLKPQVKHGNIYLQLSNLLWKFCIDMENLCFHFGYKKLTSYWLTFKLTISIYGKHKSSKNISHDDVAFPHVQFWNWISLCMYQHESL